MLDANHDELFVGKRIRRFRWWRKGEGGGQRRVL